MTRRLRILLGSAAALAAFSFALAAPVRALESGFTLETTPGALPKTIVPVDYDVWIRPDITKLTFGGSETVRISVRTATQTIVLSTHGVDVSRAAVDGKPAIGVVGDNQKQTTTMKFGASIGPGMHRLAMQFTGKIGSEPQGLFYERYSTPAGERTMLVTQMESIDARRMFPCWDEPAFRATFLMHVTIPKRFDAISNMPVTSEAPSGDNKTVTFGRTPKMSTYLVALAAGEFGYLSGAADGIPIRIVTPKGREDTGRYALGAAQSLLSYYDDYFGVKYPMPKLDLIAVPGGFPGAMENWGAIVFADDTLLFDPTIDSEQRQIDVYTTVAHEMAHQWLGDLVTMAWWDDLWLAEGFADWMETKATDHFNPQWHLWERNDAEVDRAMETDGKSTTHAVRAPVTSDTHADEAFDDIAYTKSGAFVRMTEEYLGAQTFRAGIQQYLRANAYSNTTSANLYAALGAVAHRNMAAYAKTWTIEPGYPLVDVTEACTAGTPMVAVSQQRFLYEPDKSAQNVWQVPLWVVPATGTQSRTTELLTAKSGTVAGTPCGVPVLVNDSGYGYYRARYDAATSGAIADEFEKLAPTNRVRVLYDTRALMLAGLNPADNYLSLIGRLQGDESYAVWEATIIGLDEIASFERGRPGEAAFDAYRRAVLRPVLDRIGWSGTSTDPMVDPLRIRVIAALGDAGDMQVVAEARARFIKFLTDPSSLPPNLRATVLDIVGAYADEATWEKLRSLMTAAKTADEAQIFAGALWRARNAALAQQNLALVTSGQLPAGLGPNGGLRAVGGVAGPARQPGLAWETFKANAPTLVARLPSYDKGPAVGRMLRLFWAAAPASELEAVGKAQIPADDAVQLRNAMHEITFNVNAAARIVPQVDAYFAAHPSATTATK